MLVAIETSCDETAVSIVDVARARAGSDILDEGVIRAEIVASQVRLHEPYGGVVPELAARQHVTSLPILFEKALLDSSISVKDISAIAVTRGPGLKGCLLVGLCFAKAIAYSLKKPLMALHHMEGHIFACELVAKSDRANYPCLALVVSGGHTQLVLMPEFRKYKIIATTRDDAAGEAFDKSATLLGLPYPGGPALSKRAANGDKNRFKFPIGVPNDSSSFSFSGLKTAVLKVVKDLKAGGELSSQDVDDISASAQFAIVKALVDKTVDACRQYSPRSLLLTGGVAANPLLRTMCAEKAKTLGISFVVPPPKWCTDNATMLAALALRIIENAPETFDTWNGRDGMLGPDVSMEVGAVARWPLSEL